MTILPPVPAPRNRWLPLVLITILTLAFLIVSIVLINLGQGLIFIPIIFACMYYVKRGFVFSVILVCVYSILTLSLSHDPNVLLLAVIRVPIFILVAGVITYLSLQKIRGEETLRESEERYRNVIEDQTEFICRFLPDGTHIFVNDAYCRYFDKKREDIIGHRFKPVLYPEEQEIVALHIASITPEHPVIDIDQRIMMPDGSTRWQRWSDRAIFDPDGRAVEYQSVGRDITEQKVTEEALRVANKKLTGAFETVTRTRRNFEVFFNTIEDFLFVLDEQGCILHTNETVTRRLGYTKEELYGQSVLMMHPPDRRDEAGRTVAGMLAGTIDFCPVPLMTKGGRLIPVETRVTRGEWDGSPVLFGVSKDISDLKKSEEKFSAAFHANPALMIVSTIEEGRILDVNASFLATLGYTREEVMGRTVSELELYSDPAQRKTIIDQLKENGQVRNVEVKINRKDRGLVDGLFSAITIDIAGFPRLFTVVLDITERKLNESALARKTEELRAVNDELTAAGEELSAQFDALTESERMVRESEEKFRLLIENSHDIIYTITPNGIFTFVSPSWTALLGHPVNEVEGGSFQHFVHPDDLPACLAFLQKTIETAQRQTGIEYRVRHADGTWRFHTTNGVPLMDKSGTIIAFEGIASDITERKQAEEALLQASRKLAMLNSITRHDILNQLMGLRTYLELSKMDVSDPVFLNYIQKEEQAAEAIQWQIEFTKNYQDIGGQAPKWQNMSDTIGSAVSQLKPSGVEINVAVDRAEVFADPLLEKVFYNLMENSLRHGEHVTRMDFSVKKSESGFILTYADNGVGVTLDEKKKLFQKGFGKHTGLGLFLSKEILFITGITITENGEPGKGARFEMAVPKGAWRMKKEDGV